jgi:hypothetical protein
VSDTHSFNKPTFFLGMGDWSVTNLLAAGAHERTPKRVTLLPVGATGFSQPGDNMCWKIKVRARLRWWQLRYILCVNVAMLVARLGS